jgi:hypothetical protein
MDLRMDVSLLGKVENSDNPAACLATEEWAGALLLDEMVTDEGESFHGWFRFTRC